MTVETFESEAFRVGPIDDPDRYQLGLPVGAGAEGTLYRGSLTIDHGLVLEVAIKMLHPHHRPNLALWRRRWGEQVELLRSLHAPGLVAVRDGFVGALPHQPGEQEAAETLYLVMNLVDGVPLDAWAGLNTEVSDRDKLRLLLPIAAGLDLMHSGAATGGTPVIHGDVKPGNALVTADDATVLVDFGMMRSLPGGLRQTSIAGTAKYLAPEVASEGIYTPAADRYGFGGVAYYLLTGRHPSRDIAEMRQALEEDGRDPEVVNHILAMFAAPELRPSSLANWSAQLRDSSLAMTDGPVRLAPPRRPQGAASSTSMGSSSLPDTLPVSEAFDTVPAPPALPDTEVASRALDTLVAQAPGSTGLPVQRSLAVATNSSVRARRTRWVVAGVAAVAVALAAVALVLRTGGSAAARDVRFALVPAVYPNGLVVAREWSLTGGTGDRLQVRLRVTNGSGAAVTAGIDEVIPKAVARHVSAIRFRPTPDVIVRPDPVVRYEIRDLPPGDTVEFLYDVAVPSSGVELPRLEQWADAQGEEETAYRREFSVVAPTTLASLAVNPAVVTIPTGQTYQLSPSGTMSDGAPASALVLNGLAWASDHPSTVGIVDGRITANRPGTAVISAQAGKLRAQVTVTVLPSGTTASPGSQLSAPTHSFFDPPAVTTDSRPPAEGVTLPPLPGADAGIPSWRPQTINFVAPASAAAGTSAALSATGGGSVEPVTFSVDQASHPGVCSVSGPNGSTVSYTAPGTCVIAADQAGDHAFAPAPRVLQAVTVLSAPQTIEFTAPNTGVVGSSAVLSATGGPSGQPVRFSVDPGAAGVCSLSGATVTYRSVGDCVVHADQPGDARYAAASRVTRTIAVRPAPTSTSKTTAARVPGAPRNLEATPGNAQALLDWDPPADNGGSAVTVYRVVVRVDGAFLRTLETTGTSLTVAGLTNGKVYTFRVYAGNAVGDSTYAEASARPLAVGLPGPPTNVVASPGDGMVSLSWDPPASDGGSPITAYRVVVRANGEWLRTIDTVTTSLGVPSLTNGVTYTFRLYSRNANGDSTYAQVSATPRL